MSLVKARLKDGYELTDFKKVIDTKFNEWSNTDMEKYIRPETLFGNKFDGYLNQTPSRSKQSNGKAVKPAPEWSNTNETESTELSEERKKELWDKHGIKWD